MKKILVLVCMIAFFILMLLFPKETFNGASSGLLLWFQIIIPTLLPFIIISNLLIHTNAVMYISVAIKPFIQKLFRVSEYGCYAVFVGFLCGYPMGAKVIADLLKTEKISETEGQYLLSFCNNTSPMFIISFIVMQNFRNESLLLGTIIILYLAPVICSFIYRSLYHFDFSSCLISKQKKSIHFDFNMIDQCIMNGFETITKVGGYIILFSILFSLGRNLSFIQYFLPILEITNGINLIIKLRLTLSLYFPICLGLTSFGGICALAQTKSMIQDTHLKIGPYIIQKLLTGCFAFLLAIVYINCIY